MLKLVVYYQCIIEIIVVEGRMEDQDFIIY